MASHDDVVFVSANYRLGVLGAFVHPGLETGDPLDDSGNYVTLDLIAVLKWIHDNAETFGGDPNNVTIAGQSAGCMNVWGLLQSPLAKDLFHKAICSAGLPNAYPSKLVEYRSNDILKELLKNDKVLKIDEDVDKFLKRQDPYFVRWYLRSRTPAELLAIKRFIIPTQHIQDGYVIPWAGLADLTIGHYNRVPLIMGNTDDEGTYLVGAEMFKITDKQLYAMINTPGIQFTKADIVKDEFVSKFDTLTRAGSETINGTAFTLEKSLSVYQDKLYRYKFQWRETPEPWRDLFGAIHGMDAIFYLGNFVDDKPNFAHFAWTPENKDSRERLRDQMGRYFKGFFHTGDPNTYRLPEDPVWQNKSGTMIFQ
jgi:para-nitrobenzyl esterase